MNAVMKINVGEEPRLNTDVPFDIIPVWKRVTPELAAELVEFWARAHAIPQPEVAALRSAQSVCVARDAEGRLCGVGTALLRVLPRLRQPLYYYRQFFADQIRGQRQAIPFLNRARQVLQAYNAALAQPESLGVLLELENRHLIARAARAYEPAADSTFIGYSPKGLTLRVWYFEGVKLFAPARIKKQAGARRQAPARA